MSDDIVERIEARAHDSRLEIEYMMDEAAEEITRLREVLAALIWDVENKVGDPHTLRHAKACLPQPEKPASDYDNAPTNPHHGGKIWE